MKPNKALSVLSQTVGIDMLRHQHMLLHLLKLPTKGSKQVVLS